MPDPEIQVFNTGINSNNPYSTMYIVEDPEIISTAAVAAGAAVPAKPTNTSAGDDLFHVVDDGPGASQKFARGIGHAFSGKRGLIILASIVAVAAISIWLAKRSASNAKAESVAQVTDPQSAMQARMAVEKDLSETSSKLIQLGYDKTEVKNASNIILLSRGTDIAAAAHNTSEIVSAPDPQRTNIHVVGSNAPDHYQSLNSLNMNSYLDSISKKPTNRDIVTNSAIIHGEAIEQ